MKLLAFDWVWLVFGEGNVCVNAVDKRFCSDFARTVIVGSCYRAASSRSIYIFISRFEFIVCVGAFAWSCLQPFSVLVVVA